MNQVEVNTQAPKLQSKVPSQKSALMALLWALGIAGFLVNADNRAVAPVLPAIAGDLHVHESTAGLLISAYSIPYGLFQLVYGPIADKIGKTRTILSALALFAIGTIGCGFVASFSWLLTLRIVTGIFAAGIIPIALAQIGDRFPFAERPKAISFFMSLTTSGQALGIVIGALLAQFYSWKMLFIIVGLGGLPAVLLFLKQQGSEPAVAAGDLLPLKERYKGIFSNKRSWIVFLTVCLEGAVFFGGFTYLGVYGNESLHLSYWMVGLLTALYSVAGFVGSRLITKTLQKVGQVRMPMLGSGIMTVAFALIWLWTSPVSLGIGFVMLGIGYSFVHSTLQTYATELFPKGRGTCMSLFAFFLFLGNGIGPALLGYVYDADGANGLLMVTTLSCAVFAIICTFAFRKFAPLRREGVNRSDL